MTTLALPPELCRHHWWIESPQGETSDAVCKVCGGTRTFVNYKYADYYNRLPLSD